MSVKNIILFLFLFVRFHDRFKREEIKIQAWEDHQKAKIEAEMRKVEVGHY
jgi:Remorin, C-terminal region